MEDPILDPGECTELISILAPTPITDISGQTVRYDPLFTGVWAKFEWGLGKDSIRQGQGTSESYIAIKIFYRPGIKNNMRVQSRNGIYIIQDAQNLRERDLVIKLICVALGDNE